MLDEDSPLPDRHPLPSEWGWGLAGLLIGCTHRLSACTMMVFNVLLFRGGLFGIPLGLAHAVAVMAVLGLSILGAFAVGISLRGWRGANAKGESPALAFA